MESEARKARRDPEKEKFWRATMQEHGVSGKSVREFCAEKGLNQNVFYGWRRELKLRDAEGASKGGFVELIQRGGQAGAAGVSIRVDERISVVLERGFDVEALKAALAAVGVAGGR
jgi:transposase-like protein